MSFSIKITFSTTTNQDSGPMTLAYFSWFPLHITFPVLLKLTLHWEFAVFSLIYLKHSIEFGMMISLINSRVMELTVTSLNNRYQRVVLKGQSLVWKSVTAGVPRGSVLGRLFFPIYINDLPLGLTTNVKLFADDTSLFSHLCCK